MARGKGSFWEDYRRQYGDEALPPAGRKALGLVDHIVASTVAARNADANRDDDDGKAAA